MAQAAKSFLASKTVWVNAVATLIAVTAAIADQDWVVQNPALAATCAAVIYVANIVLRFKTSQPIQ